MHIYIYTYQLMMYWLIIFDNHASDVGKTMTGNGKHTTYKNGDDWGMVFDCFTHMIDISTYDIVLVDSW